MVQDYKTIDLFGKLLFETIILKPPYKKPNLMPNEACFLYILKGEYDSISETERLKIEAQESLLMKCGNYTCNMRSSEVSDTYQALAVHFYPDILMKIYEDKLPDFLTQKLPLDIGMSKLNSDILIRKYIEGILFYFQNPDLVTEEILILKLKEIILLLNQTTNAPAIRSILSNLFSPSSYSLREIVKAHYYENISLEELAILNNQSLSSFKREFRKIYNSSPATYLREKKLEKSIQLLVSTDLRTTDIAYECGFTNASHFSKTFKNKYGISPTFYKLTHLDKPLN
ncbi:helix-turn-helix transcriptional regulator [Aquimarina sp. MMG015]|uniref:helix-turn-helix domain-containing protein n=1 Tax=unclassified Aquimarina TaxID=2627091 RepID=UPI000E4D8F98|nr:MULTISPECIES: AraC family transcriptional regulator [unclassified Aquimarina]AXT54485.1 AraC family transcriptional regulator [Aquimarina sp. AD1]MBQ4804665.1 helix-turn-helix transcriptional regulator [Aquimarina sp. MMG015]RKN02942.1 helix-turn-helix domain-containing protein [Aquimarina sp. AD1]